ncbi:MAG: hypothetical protein LBE09_00660, partial [Christensenellaceae bacterium]|nr:hypothetical protein [Christensenellaceae bacterium]
MNMCFRKILVFASLFFVLILLFVSCDSREVLNITYVIGEYGIITNDAPITQRIVNPYDLIIPIVVGKDGYFFSGFIVDAVGNNRKYIATYYEVETYFVDRTTEERVEDFTVIDITRTFVETKDYPVAPYVAISFRNMQTNAFSLYYCLAENSDMPLQVRKDDPDEDHYLSFSTRTGEMNFEESPYDMSEFLNNEHYLLLIDKSSGKIETSSYYEHFGRYGFEANLYFEFELTVGTYSGVMASLVVPVKCDHFKVLS